VTGENMLRVYGDLRSGNCYKVKLLLLLLEQEHEWVDLDILKGETQTDNFRLLNPNAKIPALELDAGKTLWESNAILNYLAEGSSYLPKDNFFRSQILQWQFFEQYSHEPYVAVARFIKLYLGLPAERKEEFESKLNGGKKALAVMDKHLENNKFFVGNKYSIADISLYAYTHVADEGGFALNEYANIQAWIERMESNPKHLTMHQCMR